MIEAPKTFNEANRMPLPRNPFKRHKVVKGLLPELQMPGVVVSYIHLPLKGRRDLEEHAIAFESATDAYAEEPPIDSEIGLGTLRGFITIHPREDQD